jgi:hypothetical protein
MGMVVQENNTIGHDWEDAGMKSNGAFSKVVFSRIRSYLPGFGRIGRG